MEEEGQAGKEKRLLPKAVEVMERALCKICVHKQVEEINSDLMARKSIRWVADKYHVSKSTVQRHNAICMARDFMLAREAAARNLDAAMAHQMEAEAKTREGMASKILSGVAISSKLYETMEHAEELRQIAMKDQDYNLAVRALDLTLKGIREYTKLAGEAREHEKVREEHIKSDWGKIRRIMNDVLDHFPEAKEIFNAKLSSVGSKIFD